MLSQMLQNTRAISICWDSDAVSGVVLEKRDDGVRYIQHHVAEVKGDLSDALTVVRDALKPNEEITLIVGGDASDFCVVDLELPELSVSDLNNAIRGEMPKHYPGDPNDIVFASRRRDDGNCRVFYMTRTKWQAMTEALAVFAPLGVDRVIPVVGALDPIGAGQDVAVREGETPLIAVAKDDGSRDLIRVEAGDTTKASPGVAGYPDELAVAPGMLAEYALSEQYVADSRFAWAVPEFIRPRRFEQLKKLAMIGGAIAALLVLVMLYNRLSHNGDQIDALDESIATAQQLIDDADIDLEKLSRQRKIEEEFLPLKVAHDKQMTVALATLSMIIDRKLWAVSYSWENADIKLELHSGVEVNDVVKRIQNTKLFDEVKMQKRKQSNGKIYYRITCRLKDMKGEGKRG